MIIQSGINIFMCPIYIQRIDRKMKHEVQEERREEKKEREEGLLG